jgi:hypothetical protein
MMGRLLSLFRGRPAPVPGPSLSEWLALRYPSGVLDGLEDLSCGCPRQGPSRPNCPIHGDAAPRAFLFSREL